MPHKTAGRGARHNSVIRSARGRPPAACAFCITPVMLNRQRRFTLRPANPRRGDRPGGAAECRRAGPGAATASATHVTSGTSVDSAPTQPGARLACSCKRRDRRGERVGRLPEPRTLEPPLAERRRGPCGVLRKGRDGAVKGMRSAVCFRRVRATEGSPYGRMPPTSSSLSSSLSASIACSSACAASPRSSPARSV